MPAQWSKTRWSKKVEMPQATARKPKTRQRVRPGRKARQGRQQRALQRLIGTHGVAPKCSRVANELRTLLSRV